MIDKELEEELSSLIEELDMARETLALCEKITKLMNGVHAGIAIPATGVVMARVIVGCSESRQEALATLAINLSKVYEMINMLYDTQEREAEEASIQ